MTDDTEEESSYSGHPGILYTILRKTIVGIVAFIILWVLLLKNAPNMFPPHVPETSVPNVTAEKTRPSDGSPFITPPRAEIPGLRPPVDRPEAKMALDNAITPVVSGTISASTRSEADKEHITGLEEHIAQLESDLAALKTQINALQTQNTHQLAAMTAFGFLREAIMQGEPFDTQMKEMLPLIQDAKTKSTLEQLQPFAEKGIPTLPALQKQFSDALPSALFPNQKGNSLARNLQSLIRIRRVGEQQTGNDDESILARAEAKTERGEITAALKEMVALSPPAADALANWIKNAEAFLLSRDVMENMQLALAHTSDIQEAAPEKETPHVPAAVPAVKPEMAPTPAPVPQKEAEPKDSDPETDTDPAADAPDENPAPPAPDSK